MKKTIVITLLSFFVLTLHGQERKKNRRIPIKKERTKETKKRDCDNFNSFAKTGWQDNPTCNLVTLLNNWKSRQAEIKYEDFASQGGSSDKYIRIRDNPSSSCTSWIFNSDDYNGNWSAAEQCLCYDFNFFSNGGGANNPPTLLQIYSGAENPFDATYVAEFVLNDPVTQADDWVTICPPLVSSGGGLPANSKGQWIMRTPENGDIDDWNNMLANVSGLAFRVDINSSTELYGIDNICFQDCPQGQEPIPTKPTFCCPGKNLLKNGDFEQGNQDINSEFMFTSSVTPSSVVPGKYSVITGADAAIISPTWASVQDPNSCSFDNGKFLATNGQTGAGPLARVAEPVPEKKVIWEQTIPVNPWTAHVFCFKAKNLNQVGFPITPKIDIEFSNPAIGNIIGHEINSGSGPCDWLDVRKKFNLYGSGSSTITFKIILDQTRHGDGNDIAIDNIALIEMEKCPAEVAQFNFQTQVQNGFFNLIATGTHTDKCNGVFWEVCEIDPNSMQCTNSSKLSNPSAWYADLNTTNFVGYVGNSALSGTAPGKFEFGKVYKITRGVFGECSAWRQFSWIVGVPGSSASIMKHTEKDFKAKHRQIMAKFKRASRANSKVKRTQRQRN